MCVRYEQQIKNSVFWDVTPCGCCKSRSVLRLLVTANIVPSSPILVTLMLEMIHSSETSVLTRATRRHIPDDGIPQVTTRRVQIIYRNRLCFRNTVFCSCSEVRTTDIGNPNYSEYAFIGLVIVVASHITGHFQLSF
jgi:hypothetical protein